MAVIRLPDTQTAVLKAKAAAEGLSLEVWLQKLAEQKRPARHRHIARNLSDLLLNSPFAGADLNLERSKD